MKLFKALMITIIICVSAMSCDNDEMDTATVEITGTLQKQGVTTYQYGTHTLSGYALRSNAVNLDDYIDQNITVAGHKIDGYPVDGGPDFIEVVSIK